MPNEIELIKQKLDIVDFIRSYVSLQPAGKNFKALCPFHQEKTPSFIVSPDRQLWHCFGACNAGGDLIKFLMLYENLEFPEALQVLAERAGIELRRISPQQQREFGILYDINAKAKEFFVGELQKNNVALDYLKNRGLRPETIKEFELGFAPAAGPGSGEMLTLHLFNLGYAIDDVVRAGLALKNAKGFYRDRFENRIIFPIFNTMGKVIAFTGRVMPELEKRQPDIAKYLNSPETLIFNKSKILYSFHKAKSEIAKTKSVFLVEGQMDALMVWQAGVRQAVAVSGSALSNHHLQSLRRLADIVYLSFDKDEAGLKALERAIETLGSFDFHVKAVDLGDSKDPAEAVQRDAGFLTKAMAEAKPALGFLFYSYLKPDVPLDLPTQKRSIRRLLGIIKRFKSPIEKQNWVRNLARHAGVSEDALIEEMNMLKIREAPQLESFTAETINNKKERLERIAEQLIMISLHREEFWPALKAQLSYLPPSFRELVENPTEKIPDYLKLQASYEVSNKDDEILKKEFEELLIHLKIESLRRKREELRKDIQLIQARGDETALEEALQTFHTVTTEIHQLSKRGA